MWWVHVDGMEAVGELRVRQYEARGWDVGQKPEIEHAWLSFGDIV
jgi:hypothetical protein